MRLVKQTNKVFNTVGRPVSSASLFYTLYYKSEVEGVDDLSFDLFQITDDLYEGFYYYGLYSIAKEAYNSNALKKDLGGGLSRTMRDSGEADIENMFSNLDSEYRDLMTDFVLSSKRNEITISMEPGKTVFNKFMTGMGKFGLFYDTDIFLNMAYDLFNIEELSDGELYWAGQFGGESWLGLIKHIRRRDEMTKKLWVDQSFSVEHNTGNWMNKIRHDTDEGKRIYQQLSRSEKMSLLEPEQRKLVRGTSLPDGVPESDRPTLRGYFSHPNGKYLNTIHMVRLLEQILDANFDGDMDIVFRYAELFNDRVDVNIRRYI